MKLILLILTIITLSYAASDFSCIDNNGQNVDWWVMLKLPNTYSDGNPFFYYDSTYGQNPDFTYQDSLIASTSPLMRTIKQIESTNSEDYASVFWNDQPSTGQSVSSTYAHSKGIIGAKDGNAFLINHSTPKFPVEENNKLELTIDSSQRIYGQHFFCVNMDFATLNEYAKGLQLDRVYTFISNVPSSLQSSLPELVTLLDNKQATGTSLNYPFKSRGNQSFIQFAKSGKYDADFYADVVAKHYNLNFNIESWGRPLMDATCGSPSVTANLDIHFSDQINYSYTKDHSKYGISSVSGSNIVCFGDVNRMTSQFKRGGGTNCLEHNAIHNFINNIMNERQQCPNSLRSKILKFLFN